MPATSLAAGATALCVALATALAAGQDGGAAAPPPAAKQEAKPALSLGPTNVDKLSKIVRSYYFNLDGDHLKNAKKDLDSLLDESEKVAKALHVADPLLAVDDWREIVRRGRTLEKPTLTMAWRGELKLVDVAESPVDPKADEKQLTGIFDGRLKAFVSMPSDFAKVAYPVIVALHPMEEEVKTLKDMTKSKVVVERVKAWAAATYTKEALNKAIVIVPIMDLVVRGKDGVSFTRPRWDSLDGAPGRPPFAAEWIFKALVEVVFKNISNFDARRIFLDGEGPGAAAALYYCMRYPGVQTGAIVRGAPPAKADPQNCIGTPILFVGKETESFYKDWKEKEGLTLDWKETLVDPPLEDPPGGQPPKDKVDRVPARMAWINDHPKNFAPTKISFRSDQTQCRASHWFSVLEDDPQKEGEPIVVDALIDRAKSEISVVTSAKVKRFMIFLNDDLLDLSKPIRVVYRTAGKEGDKGGAEKEVFNAMVKRILEDTLEWGYKRPYVNTGEIYVAFIRVDVN